MEAIAQLKFLRMSPRKVKVVMDMIRGQDVKTARAYLMNTSKSACEPVLKVLDSAKANAENNFSMDPDNLYVSLALADPGPVLKRGRPTARGRYSRILKRTTHITIGVSEKA